MYLKIRNAEMFRKIVCALAVMLVPAAFVQAQAPGVENPSGRGAMAPGLTALPGGSAAILTWIEKDGEEHVFKLSRFEGGSFAEPRDIARGDDWFANWADTPAVHARADGVLIANGECRNTLDAVDSAGCAVETFGLAESCTWRGVDLELDRGRYRMQVLLAGQPFGQLSVPLPGLHNAYNALAATALLHHAGLSPQQIAEAIAQFRGARRRMTLKGQCDGMTVLDDYAHHPTEIQATLRAIRDHYQPDRLVCVFQPHQHSRTRFLLKDFARSFGLADEVIVPEIFFVRDSDREKDHISSEDLVAQIRLTGGAAVYLETFEDIVEYIDHSRRPGDLVVTMGAGNIWKVADEIVC